MRPSCCQLLALLGLVACAQAQAQLLAPQGFGPGFKPARWTNSWPALGDTGPAGSGLHARRGLLEPAATAPAALAATRDDAAAEPDLPGADLAKETSAQAMAPEAGSSARGLATRRLARRLIAHLDLHWLRTDGEHLQRSRWSLGMASSGQLRWGADLYGDARGRPWASAGLHWPAGPQLRLSLLLTRPVGSSGYGGQQQTQRQPQLMLGGRLNFR